MPIGDGDGLQVPGQDGAVSGSPGAPNVRLPPPDRLLRPQRPP